MLDTFGSGFTLVMGMFALIALIAALVAFARVSLTRSTVEVLTQSNTALNERITIMEREKVLQDVKLAEMKTGVEKLEAENTTLRNLATGSEHIQRLADMVLLATQERQSEHHDILAMMQTNAQVMVSFLSEVKAGVIELKAFASGQRGLSP